MKIRKGLKQYLGDERGAVAPIIAVSLFALVGAGGIAFDYSRLATMDSELQTAADQAALAAATQLDGKPGATQRAEEAASNLVGNQTLLSNDGGDAAVTIAAVAFYSDKEKINLVTRDDTATTDDAEARFVEVTVGGREAFYALTPVVGAFSSGDIDAAAFAGMGSSICRTPPVMICNPFGSAGLSPSFNANVYRGYGLRLLSGTAAVPGNFGFLQTGFGSGANNLAKALGYDVPPGDCIEYTGVTTEPGQKQSVFDAISSRFDIDSNGNLTCPGGDANCSSAANPRKDLVKGAQCNFQPQGWKESDRPYRPDGNMTLDPADYPDVMGMPRDICHAWSFNGNCGNGLVGDGFWDRDAYFAVNHGGLAYGATAGLGTNVTRFETYLWELESTARRASQSVGGKTAHSQPICRAAPTAITPDRRRISAAVIDCTGLNLTGRETDVAVLKWLDLFLVEPPFNRHKKVVGNGGKISNGDQVTSNDQVYAEIIGETNIGGGDGGAQVIRRDVPYLIE